MTALPPTLQAFFTDRLLRQRRASEHTIAAYRDTWRMLVCFASHRTGKPPSGLDLADLDAPLIAAFLDHLEHDRGNSVRTRNARLAAIHSLFRFAALSHPEHAETITRVLAIPPKRFERALITHLTDPEVEALLAAPDPRTWTGRRDHALLLIAVQTGMRVSELTGLTWHDAHLGPGAHLACHGKGRKDRITPITKTTVKVLRSWRNEHAGLDSPVFPTRSGRPLSRDAVEHRITHYTSDAATRCPSLATKKVTAHVLRHTCAMRLLHAGVDTSVIALWLGHESAETTTQIYLHADLDLKEKALSRTRPPNARTGRYRPADSLLTWLEGL
ncbi:MAG: tyrosine-type recombinase/integrase [Nocardioidaceae bacterium]